MIIRTRRIFKSRSTGSATVKELLQTMFVGEILQPGPAIWIVSPWISDVALIDNRSGNFDTLNPEWGRREVRLVDVLVTLMIRGAVINIVTRDEESNTTFLNRLDEVVRQNAVENFLIVLKHNQLHTKGILLSKSLLMGSMNLTYYGLSINDESITFSIEPEYHNSEKLVFERQYSGKT